MKSYKNNEAQVTFTELCVIQTCIWRWIRDSLRLSQQHQSACLCGTLWCIWCILIYNRPLSPGLSSNHSLLKYRWAFLALLQSLELCIKEALEKTPLQLSSISVMLIISSLVIFQACSHEKFLCASAVLMHLSEAFTLGLQL